MCWSKRVKPQKQRGSEDMCGPYARQATRRAHRRPAEQEKAALTGLLEPVGAALQRLTGMHKSKVTGHSAYLSARPRRPAPTATWRCSGTPRRCVPPSADPALLCIAVRLALHN